MFGKVCSSNLSFQGGACNNLEKSKEEKAKEPKITYQLVKTGNETCDLLTLVNGKVVKTDPMSLKDAYDRYGKGPLPDNFRIAFDINQSVENSMGSTSKEDAKRMYGPQVANNFYAQA